MLFKCTLYLAGAFIQSDLQCIQAIRFFQYVCVPWELNPQPSSNLTNEIHEAHLSALLRGDVLLQHDHVWDGSDRHQIHTWQQNNSVTPGVCPKHTHTRASRQPTHRWSGWTPAWTSTPPATWRRERSWTQHDRMNTDRRHTDVHRWTSQRND